jgi:EAL domain-containing protein (putative c-di-GMP-specific phosphodiesterase class I)
MSDSPLRVSVRQGEKIFSQGDMADCAYIVEHGRIGVLVERDGAEIQIAERGRGDLFGEMAIIDGMPRSATILALEDCVLLKLTRSQLAHRIETADPIVRLLLDVILTRFRDTLAGIDKPQAEAIGTGNVSDRRDERFSDDHRIEAVAQMRLERELEFGIRNDEFELHYQPIVELRNGRVAGFEALIRWRHKERGLVPPIIFIPAAEASGLIVPLSQWCLRQACRDLQSFRRALPADRALFVSVNLSGIDLQRPDFVADYARILAETGADPGDIKLEVTEGVLMKDADRVIETLNACRSMGSTIALDDFGTGFSSMSYLSKFPIDTLKIDKSFVQALHTDRASHNIVNAIIALGWGLDIPTVAEGIENAADADALLAIGCAYGQGYFYSQPVNPAEAVLYLQAATPPAQHLHKAR